MMGMFAFYKLLVEYITEHSTRSVRPHPPIIRALQYAKERLMAAGIKIVDWKPYKHDHGWDIVVRIISRSQYTVPS